MMSEDYQRGYKDGLVIAAKLQCFLCRDGEGQLMFRPHTRMFSHKLFGKSDVKFVHWEFCRAGRLWELMPESVEIERAPAQEVAA